MLHILAYRSSPIKYVVVNDSGYILPTPQSGEVGWLIYKLRTKKMDYAIPQKLPETLADLIHDGKIVGGNLLDVLDEAETKKAQGSST